MKKTVITKFDNFERSCTVLVEVPKIDREPLDADNILEKIIDKKKHQLSF